MDDLLDHERLRVYQAALAFNEIAIKKIIPRIPRGASKVADQLFRSATSITANIAEGVGKRSRVERASYYDHARGSATESSAHLDIIRLLHQVDQQDIAAAKALIVSIIKMMTVMLQKL